MFTTFLFFICFFPDNKIDAERKSLFLSRVGEGTRQMKEIMKTTLFTHCDTGLDTLKLHSLDLMEDIKRLGNLEPLHALSFEGPKCLSNMKAVEHLRRKSRGS